VEQTTIMGRGDNERRRTSKGSAPSGGRGFMRTEMPQKLQGVKDKCEREKSLDANRAEAGGAREGGTDAAPRGMNRLTRERGNEK